MIDQTKITPDWINKISKEHRNADKILVEKVIRALLLLEGLVKQNVSFVFKGGTALMLLLNSAKRLSIDIDIILPNPPQNLNEILDAVVKEQGFLRKELQHRDTESEIKKAHYKFYYTPIHQTRANEEIILLDILIEETNYNSVIQVPITSPFIPVTSAPLLVNVPSIEDILGDKLTAFAPNTTGIPYLKKGANMSMEILKQLYDIGNLVDVAEDAEIVKETFSRFAATELAYRNQNTLTPQNVIDDIYQTALTIVSRGVEGNGNFNELQLGIQRVGAFIFSESFHLEKAIILASKAAYIATIIKNNGQKIEKYANPLQMVDWTIREPFWQKLNKLKRSNPEAFFYWYKISDHTKVI